ncbi:hypothetical protein ViNHUV68_14570 [Vibrio sp. NH-UV-68]
MENLLASYPEVQAVFAQNDEMALGAIKAIQASNKSALVVGFDGTDEDISSVNISALSFPSMPECALTLSTSTYFLDRSSSTCFQSLRCLTGFLFALRQPRSFQSSIQMLKPFTQ